MFQQLLNIFLHLNLLMISSVQIFHNQIAVQVQGGEEVVDKVAMRTGMTNLGRIGDLTDFYLLESHHINKR